VQLQDTGRYIYIDEY